MVNIGQTIRMIEEKHVRKNFPNFQVGDTLHLDVKVAEGDKIRLHPFEGTVIRKTGRGVKGTFTVRKVSFGEGVEKTFPLNSPVIDSMKIVGRGEIKRAKLYYLRERVGKKIRLRGMHVMNESSTPETPVAAEPVQTETPAQS